MENDDNDNDEQQRALLIYNFLASFMFMESGKQSSRDAVLTDAFSTIQNRNFTVCHARERGL